MLSGKMWVKQKALFGHTNASSAHGGPLYSVHFLLCLQGVLQGPGLGWVSITHSFDFHDVATYVHLDGGKHWGPQ